MRKSLIKILIVVMLFSVMIVNVYAVSGTYYFWSNGVGTVRPINNGNGSFSVVWNNCGDFICGINYNPGSANRIVTYSGSCIWNTGGGYLGFSGWTTNPLIEYIIIEAWGGPRPASGVRVGSVTSDGGTYDIYRAQRVNQPSIIGIATFYQYLSIRQSPRTSGIITVKNHLTAFKNAGLNLGTLNYQLFFVEGWNGSGSATMTVQAQ